MSKFNAKASKFLTGNFTVDEANELIFRILNDDGSRKGPGSWKKALETKLSTDTIIGYNRGWLLVREAEIAMVEPHLFVSADKLIEEFRASGKVATLPEGATVEAAALSATVKTLQAQKASWGEIMVRLGVTEGTARKAFEFGTAQRSVGQRTGKGGRFVADAGELYQENRKAEGAHIPLGVSTSAVRQDITLLANYIAPAPVAAKVASKKASAPRKQVAKKTA